jgi:hypothetical protein
VHTPPRAGKAGPGLLRTQKKLPSEERELCEVTSI